MEHKQFVLASRPMGMVTKENFRSEKIVIRQINEGEVLLKPLFFSVDPYMRGRMNSAKSYAASFELDKAIKGGAVARVAESKNPNYTAGDLVLGTLPWSTLIIAGSHEIKKIDKEYKHPEHFLGVLGMTGLTAYIGMIDICRPVAGDTAVISGAAGAVGLVAGQIAKIMGLRVIGIAGTDDKCQKLKNEFGFDEALNYKTSKSLRKDIAALCPDGVDIYFDNVGGEITEAVASSLDFNARIALCGQISQYNNTKPYIGFSILPHLLTRSVTLQGFIVSNYSHRFDDALNHLSKWLSEGKLKFSETITEGFDNLPDAFIGLFSGANQGKMLVKMEE